MALLNKEQVLSVKGKLYKDIDVEELGGQIRVSSMSAGAVLDLKEAGVSLESTTRKLAVVAFASCIVDEQKEPLFDQEEAAKFIDTISVDTMRFITNEIMRLTAKSQGKDLEKKVDAAIKNGAAADAVETPTENPSEAARSDASPTA